MVKRKNKIEFKTYPEVLESLDNHNNHLLLGNGFNGSLGVKTDYRSIFEKMKCDYKGYNDLTDVIEDAKYDLEKVIGILKSQLKEGGGQKSFLDKYINAKIKFDFMKATHEILKEQIKNVYQEKNEEVYLLFKNFQNYFTLNYDSFLYLLLMKFKKDDTSKEKDDAIAIQHTFKFQEIDMNDESDAYKKISEAHNDGIVITDVNGLKQTRNLNRLPKRRFEDEVKDHYKEEFSSKSIQKAVNLLWRKKEEREKGNKLLYANDGFLFDKDEFIYKSQEVQNIFFLHGAFHLYQKNEKVYKITQKTDKALYERLEEILENEGEEIVCVFTDTNKDVQIKKNKYLTNACEKLATLHGKMVIIGISLSDNDSHIFENIRKSRIDAIYIASKKSNMKKDYDRAVEVFKGKDVMLFDRDTISYG
ncbi:MAG: DUF4917 family protein [Candidatus Omnitrophica bacterium]|nr:DUF4917 family protein [Candidatus Omnitrophota bacterium]